MSTAAPPRRRPGGRFRTHVLALLVVGALCATATSAAHAATKRTNNPDPDKCPAGLQLLQQIETGTYAITYGGESGSIALVVRTTAQGPLVDFTTDAATHLVDRVVVTRGTSGNSFDYRPDGTTAGTVYAPRNPATGKYSVPSYLCVETRLKPPPPPTDVCPNIPGVQTEIPPGMIKDANGNCVTPPPPPTDVCPNIPGVQTEIPPGMTKDANGNCVTPPPPPTPSIDLAVVKVDTPDPVSVGRTVRYEITVRNHGPGKATGVVLTDPLPTFLEIVSVRTSQGSCTVSGRTVTCNLLGLTAGSKAVVKVVARALRPGAVLNTARVTGDQPDPRENNNTSTAVTLVVAPFQPPSAVCDSVTVGRRTVVVGRATTLRVFVKANGRALAGERVRVSGAGVDVSARTSRRGVAVVTVTAKRPGVISIRVTGEPCSRRIGAVGGDQPDLTG